MKLTDFKALTFDCYGTLIDWETGLYAALEPLAARAPRPRSREEALEDFGVYEHSQEHYTPTKKYSELLATVYKRLAEHWGTPAEWSECLAFGRSIKDWPAFPDSPAALKYLKQHYRLYPLTNVDNESFAPSNRKLEVQFDGVMTAEDIGSYKPSHRNFEYLFEQLGRHGIERSQVLHVAQSLLHDHTPANELGIASCWIDRRHGKTGGGATRQPANMPRYNFRFTSLGELADAHRKELAG
jgi:2-haloalkanoic acid dehalogenase type II